MISINNSKRDSCFDPWEFLSPKLGRLLDQSWKGVFQKELLYELPIGGMGPFFTEGFGGPTKEQVTVMSDLVVQHTHDLPNGERVNKLALNIQWHYAFNITEELNSVKYICSKTLWNMRGNFVEKDMDDILFEGITDKLAKVFKVKSNKQRIDSVHIKSNIRRLGRVSIFVTSINKFLLEMKRSHEALFDTVKKDIVQKYLAEKALKWFYMLKPSESSKTVASVSSELFDLIQQFKDHPELSTMTVTECLNGF